MPSCEAKSKDNQGMGQVTSERYEETRVLMMIYQEDLRVTAILV